MAAYKQENGKWLISNTQRVEITCPTCGAQFKGQYNNRFTWRDEHRAHTNGAKFSTVLVRK